ncbi:MAG: hypothetical protein HQK49_11225 [Oligoflexia bacterium]|nr:hypothetical protein [Oligoflexia bacterium]
MKTIKLLLSFSLLLMSVSVFAVDSIDFIPTKLTFKKGLDDDVSMSYSQHVYITIKNVGNKAYTKARGFNLMVQVGAIRKSALIYGPATSGGLLGGDINPGQEGLAIIRLPLNTLKHCQKYNVLIDVLRTVQMGPMTVFANDAVNLQGTDKDSIIRCLNIGPIHPVGPIIINR